MSAAPVDAKPITVDFALDLHGRGFSIVPIRADGSKRPDLAKWEQYQERLPTEAEIRRWFGGRPRYGYGIVCGAVSGQLEMLEFEGQAVELGLLEDAEKLAVDNGLGCVWNTLLGGYMEVTPRDGIHLLFRTEKARPIVQLAYGDPYVNEKGKTKVPVLIETRGEGGQFVAAGSGGPTHENGRSWELIAGSLDTIPTITIVQRDRLYELLATLDRRPPAPEPEPTAPRSGPRPAGGGTTWLEATIEDYNARESWATVLAGHFIYRHSKGQIDYWHYNGAENDTSATTNAKGTDRLTIFSSTAGGARWRVHTGQTLAPTYDKFSARCFIEMGREDQATRVEFAKELQRRGFGPEWDPDADRRRFEDDLNNLIDGTARAAAEGVGDSSGQREPSGMFLDWSMFWGRERREAAWLYEPVLARGRGHALFAGHKVGKSLLMLSIGARLATSPEPVVVIYLDFEMTEDDVYERLADMGYGPDSDLDRLRYAVLPSLPPFDTPAGGEALCKVVDAEQERWPDHHVVVLIDTMARAVAGEEDKADTYSRFYANTGIHLKRRGVTWARLDHAGKDLAKGQRGSSAKGDDVDVVWQVTRSEAGLLLARKASRMSWVPEKVALTQLDQPLRFEPASHGWPAGTEGFAELLDALGVAIDATERVAGAAVRESGRTVTQALLRAALRWRRQRQEAA